MKKNLMHNLTPDEKRILRKHKIKIADLREYKVNEIIALLDVSLQRAKDIQMQFVERVVRSHAPKDHKTKKRGMTIANTIAVTGGIAELANKTPMWNKILAGPGILSFAEQMSTNSNTLTMSNVADIISFAGQLTQPIPEGPYITSSAMDRIIKSMAEVNKRQGIITGSLLNSDLYKSIAVPNFAAQIAESSVFSKMNTPEWQKVINNISDINLLAESSLAGFKWQSLGRKINMPLESVRTAQENFVSLTGGYNDLIKSFQEAPSWLIKTPTLAKIPTLEYYSHSTLLETISNEKDPTDDEIKVLDDVGIENGFSIENWLPRVHNKLLNLWLGAIHALESNNPDKVRHFSTSIREIFTHVIHTLAPDDSIRAWSSDSSFYHDGKPTRKARLYYICRNIAGGSYQGFMEKDIAATIELIYLFQKGTHQIESDFTEYQLRAIKTKAETSMRFILETEFNTNR